jgi:tetratricopeptide (TPR) repeat protein
MRKCCSITIFIFLGILCLSQTPKADSLKLLLSKEKAPLNRFDLCIKLVRELITVGKVETVPNYTNELFKIAAEQNNDSLLVLSYFRTALYFDSKTDTKDEINYCLKALTIAEKKCPSMMPRIYNVLGSAYIDLENYEDGLKYLRKAKMLIESSGHEPPTGNIYFQFALVFNKLHQADSVLHYAHVGSEYLVKHPNPGLQRNLLSLMGSAYEQLGNNKLAESYYVNSINEDTSSKAAGDARQNQVYSLFLLKQGKLDKAKFYCLRALDAAKSSQMKLHQLESVNTMQKIYEAMKNTDSAFYFTKQELALRDTLYNQSKLNAVQNMTFNEQIRQQEEAIKKSKEALQRQHNLQYVSIALALVIFVILFFLLSHSIVANQRLIRFLGILALLISFEFINLLIHPSLASFTHESPVWMLIILVAIGAMLIPLHHKLEHWITHRLVEKNKRIRLAAAKKTIEQLEGKDDSVLTEGNTNAQQ